MTACLNHGFETRPSFRVTVKHGRLPLTHALVHVSNAGKAFTLFTDGEGRVEVQNLVAGDYWIDVEFLGVGAAYACFHVAEHPTHKAKRKLKYQWGDMEPSTRQLAGKLIDMQLGKGGTPLAKLVRVEVPIAGASLELQNADTGATYKATSDSKGTFDFGTLAFGTYVLPAAGTDQIIEINPHASKASILLRHREASAGSCGETTTLEFQD